MMTASAVRRNVIVGGMALIGTIIAAGAFEAWQNYGTAVARSEETAQSLSRVLAAETGRIVREADAALADFAAWAETPDAQAAPLSAVHGRLLLCLRSPHIQAAALIGADGRLRGSAAETNWPADWSASDTFIAARQAPQREPYISGEQGRDDLLLSRRVHDVADAFSLILARVDLSSLSALHAELDMAPEARFRLLRADGQVLDRFGGDARTVSAADSTVRVVRSKVSGYPLIMEVVEPMAGVSVRWHRRELASAASTAALVLVAAALVAASAIALRRRERSDQKRVRTEKQLRQSMQAESLGMFAASIAHDFNNVLGVIMGYGELALEALPEDSSVRGNIKRLLQACERARQLVRRVLTFDLRRGTRNARLDIEPIAVEVLDQIRARLPANITLRLVESPAAKAIRGDAIEVHQVIMNLCSNAVRAMPDGGKLNVSIENVLIEAKRSLWIGTLSPGEWVRVSVADSGVGMDAALLATIFEPFSTTKHEAHGAGIAVVNNIVASMGGAIAVETQVGRGSTFSVFWPAAREVPMAVSQPGSLGDGHGEIIMVVDDDATLVEIAEELLASLKYEPVGFTDPTRALEALRQDPFRYDALLSDQQLSNTMRGTDLARAVRALGSKLPIVLMTGHRDAHLKDRAEAAGVLEILDKPLRSEQLREVFTRLLPAKHPAHE